MANFPNQICISGASRGFLVDIGCKRLVFTDSEIDVFLVDLRLLMTGGSKGYENLQRSYFPEDFKAKERYATTGGAGLNQTHLAPPPPQPICHDEQVCEDRPPRY